MRHPRKRCPQSVRRAAACLLTLAASAALARAPTGWTTGGKSVLILRIAFTDNPAPADPPGGWTNVMNEVNAFYLHGSYGKAWISGFTIAPVINLGVAATNYEPMTYWKTSSFLPDVRAKAKLAGYDTDQFDLEVIQTRIAGTVGGASGNAIHGGKGIWLNYTNGYAKFALATAHEIGHNLGLFHTRGFSAANYAVHPLPVNGVLWDEYGGTFDSMGYGPTNPPADFCAYDKNFLGWLPDAQVVRPVASGTFRIHAFDGGGTVPTNPCALSFARDPGYRHWFEFRQAISNSLWSMNGLHVYWGGENVLASGGSPFQLDATPASRGVYETEPQRLADATMLDGPLLIGRTFADTNADFFITPVRKGGTAPESLDLVVNLGPFPSNRAPVVVLTGTNATPATNQTVAFAVAATDPDGDALAYYWEFDDPATGTGSGVVPFGGAGGVADAGVATNAVYAWTTAGVFEVRCTVTDMKGGRVTASLPVTVGGGGGAITITGFVRDESGNPLEGALVNNLKPSAPGAAPFGSTNFLASSETASNGQFTIRVRPNTTNHLHAFWNGRTFATNALTGAQTAIVVVATSSVSNVVFTRRTNRWNISGSVLIGGNTRVYNPLLDGPMTVTELRSGQSTNVTTNGTWQFTVGGGPVELAFASASNHPVRHGFPNPSEVHGHYGLFTVFADVTGAVSSQGFATNALAGNGAATNIALPVVLTPPTGWTNPVWYASTWLGAFVDERSTAAYGVDYRLDGMEINFDSQTTGFTNFVTLHVLPGTATNSRLVVLHLEGFNAGANVGANSNFTYAIIPPAADADGDGMPDGWEWSRSQSLTNLDPAADADGDGADNLAEYLADTDPGNAASVLAITAAAFLTNGLRLDWTGGTGVTQYVEMKTDLAGTNAWRVLATNPPPTAVGTSAQFDPATTGQFFRIRAVR